MRWTLLVNLLGGDLDQANLIWNPMVLEAYNLSPQAGPDAFSDEDCSRPGFTCHSNEFIRYLPAIMVVLFYACFMLSSNLLWENVARENENRTLEVLMLSVTPRQLLAGKVIGLGLAALLQTMIWLGSLFLMVRSGNQVFNLPAEFTFPLSVAIWGLIFFLGGYAVYASLMAGAGALVPKLKEVGQVNMVLLTPLMLGYLVGFLTPLADVSNAMLPVALSLFPLTAPIVMVMRLTDDIVPLWQLLLSVGLMLGTAYLIIRATAVMFHAQNLLSGQSFSLKRYFRLLLGSV